MDRSHTRTPLADKKRLLLAVRIAFVVILLGVTALLRSDPAVLSGAVLTVAALAATGFYLVEARYARALERVIVHSRTPQ